MAIFREIGDVRGIDHCLVCPRCIGPRQLQTSYDTATRTLAPVTEGGRQVGLPVRFLRIGGSGCFTGSASSRHAAVGGGGRRARDLRHANPALAHFSMDYEGRLAAVRAGLGEKAFEEAWEEG